MVPAPWQSSAPRSARAPRLRMEFWRRFAALSFDTAILHRTGRLARLSHPMPRQMQEGTRFCLPALLEQRVRRQEAQLGKGMLHPRSFTKNKPRSYHQRTLVAPFLHHPRIRSAGEVRGCHHGRLHTKRPLEREPNSCHQWSLDHQGRLQAQRLLQREPKGCHILGH